MYKAATSLAVVLSVAGDTDGLASRLEPIYQSLLRNLMYHTGVFLLACGSDSIGTERSYPDSVTNLF